MRVLLPLFTFPDPSPEAGVKAALKVASQLRATASALLHEVLIPPVSEPFANAIIDVAAMSEAAERQSRARGEELRRVAQGEADRLGLHVEFSRLRMDRMAGEAIAAMARTFDLAFLAGRADSPDHAMLIEDVLFRSGGPSIVFPSDAQPKEITSAAIAWDGSRAAARALRDAVPVLQSLQRVVIVSVTDDKDIPEATMDAAATFLSSHGVRARTTAMGRGASAIGDSLQSFAIEDGAELLVMGAYGHSRLREIILGGATKSVLSAPKLPVLMSH